MRWWSVVLGGMLALVVTPVQADPIACTLANTWQHTPGQQFVPSGVTDTFCLCFKGRDTFTAHAITISKRRVKQADASPAGMVIASSHGTCTDGKSVCFTLAPDTGCGTAGCREGNTYQVDVQPTETGGNQPIASTCLTILKPYLNP